MGVVLSEKDRAKDTLGRVCIKNSLEKVCRYIKRQGLSVNGC